MSIDASDMDWPWPDDLTSEQLLQLGITPDQYAQRVAHLSAENNALKRRLNRMVTASPIGVFTIKPNESADLRALRAENLRLKSEIAALNGRITQQGEQIIQQGEQVIQLKQQMDAEREQLKQQMDNQREQLKQQMDNQREQLKQQMDNQREQLKQQMENERDDVYIINFEADIFRYVRDYLLTNADGVGEHDSLFKTGKEIIHHAFKLVKGSANNSHPPRFGNKKVVSNVTQVNLCPSTKKPQAIDIITNVMQIDDKLLSEMWNDTKTRDESSHEITSFPEYYEDPKYIISKCKKFKTELTNKWLSRPEKAAKAKNLITLTNSVIRVLERHYSISENDCGEE